MRTKMGCQKRGVFRRICLCCVRVGSALLWTALLGPPVATTIIGTWGLKDPAGTNLYVKFQVHLIILTLNLWASSLTVLKGFIRVGVKCGACDVRGKCSECEVVGFIINFPHRSVTFLFSGKACVVHSEA